MLDHNDDLGYPIWMRSTENLRLEHLREIVEIIGLMESSGKLHAPNQSAATAITAESISDLMGTIMAAKRPGEKFKEDPGRQIKNAKQVFNGLSKGFSVTSSRRGYEISGVDSESLLKNDTAYDAILLLALAFMTLNGRASIDLLTQLKAQEFPLAFLLFLEHAICASYRLSFNYTNRRETAENISGFVPRLISCKVGHWYVIGQNSTTGQPIQYLIHSMENVHVQRDSEGESLSGHKNLPSQGAELHEGVFGHAVLSKTESLLTVKLRVPLSLAPRVRKRRSEGEWIQTKDHWIWTIKTFDPEEVFAYVFRWGGSITIESPEQLKTDFSARLRNILATNGG